MENLRLTVRDAIQEYLTSGVKCFGDPVDVTCDIADVVFDALGISPEEQDIENARVKIILPKKKNMRGVCKHSWVDADNEGVYGQEMCRLCGKRRK